MAGRRKIDAVGNTFDLATVRAFCRRTPQAHGHSVSATGGSASCAHRIKAVPLRFAIAQRRHCTTERFTTELAST
jgi:hypothetical protein